MAQSVISSKSTDRSTKAPAEPRHFWTLHEDETLIQSLKELRAEGWKCDGSFKGGYMVRLETLMQQKLPGCGLRIKHIKSKLQVWKKTYAALLGILSTSGGARATMDPSTHTIVIDSESVWDEYVKVHPEAHSLKNGPYPMYDSWVEIFGIDRATGVGSIDVGNIVTELLNEARAPNIDTGTDDTTQPPTRSAREDSLEGAENDTLSTEATSGSVSKKKTNPLKKRKHSDDAADAFESMMRTWMEDTKVVLSSIADQLNQPKQTQAETDSSRKTALFQALRELPVLSLDDRIKVTPHLAHNKGDRDAFWGMDK